MKRLLLLTLLLSIMNAVMLIAHIHHHLSERPTENMEITLDAPFHF